MSQNRAYLGGSSDDCAHLSYSTDDGKTWNDPFGEYTDKRLRFIAPDGSEIIADLRYEHGGWGVDFQMPCDVQIIAEQSYDCDYEPWCGEGEDIDAE